MRISPQVLIGTVLLSAAVAACTGGTNSSPPPPPTNGQASLSTSPTLQSYAINGFTGTYVFPTGSGTAQGTASATPPSPLPALPNGQTPLFYTTYAGSGTLSGLPGLSVTLPAAPAKGTNFYQAQWSGSLWLTVGAAGTVSGTTLNFNAGTTAIPITSTTPIYVAVYSGTTLVAPTPTPSPTPVPTATPTSSNVIANGNFESGSLTPIGAFPAPPVVTNTGWSQCSINRQAGAPSPSPYPFTKYTPTPSETPGANIDVAGMSVAEAPSPPPPIGSVVAVSPTHAAVLGGYFYDFSLNDYVYNGICQLVTIPNNATLSMSVLGSGGNGTSTTTASNFNFVVDLLDTNNNFVQNLYTEFNQSDTAYRQISSASTAGFSSLSPYAGKTYQLFIGVWVGSTGSRIGFYFVDNVSLTGM
jgi:hypothetical protein